MQMSIILDKRLFNEEFLETHVKTIKATMGYHIAYNYKNEYDNHMSRTIFNSEAFNNKHFICEDLYDGTIKFSIADEVIK